MDLWFKNRTKPFKAVVAFNQWGTMNLLVTHFKRARVNLNFIDIRNASKCFVTKKNKTKTLGTIWYMWTSIRWLLILAWFFAGHFKTLTSEFLRGSLKWLKIMIITSFPKVVCSQNVLFIPSTLKILRSHFFSILFYVVYIFWREPWFFMLLKCGLFRLILIKMAIF